eukprot:5022388-Amphidinium_carterae.1
MRPGGQCMLPGAARDLSPQFAIDVACWLLHSLTGECVSVRCTSCALTFDTDGYGHLVYVTDAGQRRESTVSDLFSSSLHQATVEEET